MDRCWDNINRSQTHESGNWDCGLTIPFPGVHKWDFRCSVLLYIQKNILLRKIQEGVYSQNLHVDYKIVAIWFKKNAHKNEPFDKFVCKVKLFYF